MQSMLLMARIGFVVLTLFYFVLVVREFRQALKVSSWDENRKKKFLGRIIVSLIAWAVFVSAWSLSGVMGNFSIAPFNVMPVLFIPLIAMIILVSSGTFNEVLKNIPPANLIRLQSFRIFVELLLWALFIENLLPEQMTFEGRNFDILAGITAPFIAWLASHKGISTRGLVLWNIICLGLLINIVSIAILSMPGPFRIFMNEPSNTIVAQFPISWLPGFLVPLAYSLHFLSLKQLRLIRSTSRMATE
jgi:hypothetical protein